MDERQPVRKMVEEHVSGGPEHGDSEATETLVVVSKVKKYIREHSGFNTSQDFIEAVTRKVVDECKRGIESARNAGRKTVMGRDIA